MGYAGIQHIYYKYLFIYHTTIKYNSNICKHLWNTGKTKIINKRKGVVVNNLRFYVDE